MATNLLPASDLNKLSADGYHLAAQALGIVSGAIGNVFANVTTDVPELSDDLKTLVQDTVVNLVPAAGRGFMETVLGLGSGAVNAEEAKLDTLAISALHIGAANATAALNNLLPKTK